ncbi:calsyntenin-1-like isoform X1 [Pecten maximus]|uniref:calsyntenin-1-like isoform X1 n=1 Tax=Pecten maximus TaxID=6579 RepID=UPI001458183F|nr:calsyntenin-1-like isoform X1 [Pecten maximus]
MEKIHLVLFLVLFVGHVYSMSEPNMYDPVIQSQRTNRRGVPVFKGTIGEDQTTVKLDSVLRAYDNDSTGGAKYICGYDVISVRHEVPFVVDIKNRATGEAVINLVEGAHLNFEKRARYKFSVIAFDCGTPRRESNKAIFFIRVKDVDEFPPKFIQDNYFVEMDEGRFYDSLVHVRATDSDRSPEYRGICGYEILTNNVPFTIDRRGNLRNTEVIHYKQHHNFILELVAVDCGGKRSKKAVINIKMREVCKSGWQDIPDHINYDAGSGQVKLVPGATLKWCDNTCMPQKVKVKMHLATKHIGKGCDRDTYSIVSQRKLCGANDNSVDLLPSPSLTTTYTSTLHVDDGHESDQIFYFDGQTNAVEVPTSHFNHSLHQHFTISTWMKHEFEDWTVSPDGRPEKEHIVCMSDGEGMNRHHYSWFVHGEKLVFLLRREAEDEEDMEVFKPAEWRWRLPQINDGDWHYYAISVDFPHVRLYIDGKLLIPDQANMEVVDDWPLHNTVKVHSTKLVVGACWQGGKNKFEHYLRGFLAGLSILKGQTESDRVIHCLNSCKENLDFKGTKALLTGSSVSYNSEMTEFTIEGKNVTKVQNLVRDIVYLNARQFPTPGRRNIDISTNVHCNGKEVILPIAETYVMVNPAPIPSISLSGPHIVQSTASQLLSGQRVFSGIHIGVDFLLHNGLSPDEDEDEDEEEEDGTMPSKIQKLQDKLSRTRNQQETIEKDIPRQDILLDTCTIRADPPLDFRVEHLNLPESTISRFNMHLEGSETNSGLVITNADSKENYERVMQELYYFHNKGNSLNSRKFILSCSSQSGRFISNQLEVKIVSVHNEPRKIVHAHAQENHIQQFKLENSVSGSVPVGVAAHASPNVGMVAIIVVCVGFLLFMIILGVIRIRAAHRRTVVQVEDKMMEMEWDNSALNITVNPMEQKEVREQVFEYEDVPMKLRDDSDSDDDIDSYHDDCDSSDEEDEEVVVKKLKDLEWDDSTLSF